MLNVVGIYANRKKAPHKVMPDLTVFSFMLYHKGYLGDYDTFKI